MAENNHWFYRGFSHSRTALRLCAVAIWLGLGQGLVTGVSSATADDEELCTKGSGNPAMLAAACSRALDGWFVTGPARDNLKAARAYHYIDANQPQKALDDLDEVLKSRPRWARSLNDRCLALIMLKRYSQAVSDCEKAIEIDPKLGFAYKNIARAYTGSGNYSSAANALGRYLNKFPGDAPVLAQRGELREKLGQLDFAEADYKDALRREPDLSAAMAGLARLRAKRERANPSAVAAAQPERLPAPASPPASSAAASPSSQSEATAALDPALIRRIQAALQGLGYATGNPDGVMGRRTRSAIDRYRKSQSLRADVPLDETFVTDLEKRAAEHVRQVEAKAEADREIQRERAAAEAERKLALEAEQRRLLEERTKAEAAARAREEAEAKRAAAAAAEQRLIAERERREAERQRLAAEEVERAAREAAAAERVARAEAERQQAAAAGLAKRIQAEAPTAAPVSDGPSVAETLALAKPDVPPTSPPMPRSAPTDTSRIALVIGNGAYRHAPALPNPRNDASDVAALLSRMGFTVLDGTDLDRDAMEDLMIRFAKAASRAEVAIAFYAGHGIQVEGTNYLIPVDASVEDELDLRRLIRLDEMVRDTGRADRFGLVLVDACRDNPFEAVLARALGSATRSTGPMRGLAQPVVPPKVLVAYATGATQTAADGTGRNSPFTAAVLKHLGEPDDVRFVVGRIVEAVAEASQQRQRPDYWGSLGSERIFLVQPEALAEALDVQLTLAERKAVQRSLLRVGLYGGADDGQFGPAVRRAISAYQVRSGSPATGYLTVEQMVALHEQSRYGGGPAPLPPVEIIDLLRRSESGEVEAMLLRAQVHDRAHAGGPLPKDMAEAARWYRRAAEAGNAEAALALGRLLHDGDGVAPDPAESARWLRAAADAGSADAQYALALAYLDGTGVSADQSEAIRLLRLAAEGDRGEAIARLRALKAWEG